jgi:predicted PhzF superfamily epimerase YddE/YHI9
MRADPQKSGGSWIGLLMGLALGATTSFQSFAQTVEVSSSPASGSSSTLAAYLQERQTLAQERQALVAQGAPRSN